MTKNVTPLSGRLKIVYRHFSKSFSPPKICKINYFFTARICRGGHADIWVYEIPIQTWHVSDCAAGSMSCPVLQTSLLPPWQGAKRVAPESEKSAPESKKVRKGSLPSRHIWWPACLIFRGSELWITFPLPLPFWFLLTGIRITTTSCSVWLHLEIPQGGKFWTTLPFASLKLAWQSFVAAWYTPAKKGYISSFSKSLHAWSYYFWII